MTRAFEVLLLIVTLVCIVESVVREPRAKAAEAPFATPEQLDVKNAAVTQCTMEQRVPVMGFNLKVVCLELEGRIAWIR